MPEVPQADPVPMPTTMANPVAAKPSGKKPKLAVTTPLTASFPRDKANNNARLSAVSLPSAAVSEPPQQTPLSAVSRSSAFRDLPSAGRLPMSAGPGTAVFPKRDDGGLKTPITPPVAYIDFLRGMALQSPSTNGPVAGTNCAASTGSECDDDKDKTMTSTATSTTTSASSSAPVSASSTGTDLSCKCESPDDPGPRSIPPVSIPGLAVPPSPVALAATAAAAGETPLSALTTPASPFSARSVRSSPFDWDAAMQAARRRSAEGVVTTTTTTTTKETNAPAIAGTKRDAGVVVPAVRHVREVVTRTVTYTPRVGPAPKGKRRKMDHETASEP